MDRGIMALGGQGGPPFADDRMSIGKCHAGRATMTARWSVHYVTEVAAGFRHLNAERGIIDKVLCFVNEDPGFRRALDTAQLVVGFVLGVWKMATCPKCLTHGITANPQLGPCH